MVRARPLLMAALLAALTGGCHQALPAVDAGEPDGRQDATPDAATDPGTDGAADSVNDTSSDVLPDSPGPDRPAPDDRRPLGPAVYGGTVQSFQPADGGGFNGDLLPGVVQGPPQGGSDTAGSTDVVSLGPGGSLTLALEVDLVDGPGPDLVIFENAFYVLGDREHPFAEPAVVGVSLDGQRFTEWPCQTEPPYQGCAGVAPVYLGGQAPTEGADDPLDPASGGDRFDLRDVGIPRARFVRIRDAGLCCAGTMGTAGFDLDALALLNHQP